MDNNISKLKVSVIIPVYQAVSFLERAVKSALIQENVEEIILVEDGSMDGSYELCQELQQKYSIVRLYTHEERSNKGQSASRNFALKHTSGQWIQFLDADDELFPGKIASQLSKVEEDTPFVVGNAIDKFLDGREHKRKHVKDIWEGLFLSKAGITSANLWNKTYLDKVGGFDSKLMTSVEYDLMFRMLQISEKPAFDDSYLIYIHMTPNSICRDDSKQQLRIKNWIGLRKRIKEYLESQDRFNKFSYKFYYSAGIGSYLSNNDQPLNSEVNHFYFKVYLSTLEIKKSIFKLLNPIKINNGP
ncbi:glycosyltransferase family 2 protein [Arthrospiribacter ruber]|uniref:Glycosyltransferase family 2 protein n=1 Tax=Arthrospiribacter ruber TaxID=2487934 RepID=A0A951IRS7_9BACT|nr:glycosyltransferase family 2 protein [Arthrospiribacter ruber]MBW3466590.1 glycosyltransferase family 2 protein [Arthrospiribacter ruber]